MKKNAYNCWNVPTLSYFYFAPTPCFIVFVNFILFFKLIIFFLLKKDVTTTTSSLSDSSGNSNQSPHFTMISNDNNQTDIIVPIQIGNNASEASTPT